MAELTKELKDIKKKYGEKFMHICRDNFASLLEEKGLLTQILDKYIGTNTKSIGDDIIKNDRIIDFKDFIFNKVDVEKEKKQIIEDKTPYQILDEAGYNLIECKTEEEIQEFRRYYSKDELICTIYNGGRLKKSVVFFAVKKDVENIKRENFTEPKREDEYGTSVLGIQFDKKGTCMPHIITRYNHTVNNPNATFGNNLDQIAPGLTESFAKLLLERGLKLNKSNVEEFELPGYTVASDGKYYKYNMEIDGKYYCPGNIIIGNGTVQKLENPESQMLIDYFILDTKQKKIQQVEDMTFKDSFIDFFEDKEIENINIEKEKDASKIVRIKIKDLENDVLIKIDRDNNIMGYDSSLTKTIGNNFLVNNEKLAELSLPNVETIGDNFLWRNKELTELSLPNAETIGNNFLYRNKELTELSLPNAETIGDSFLYFNRELSGLSLPNAETIGDNFLCLNKELIELSLPNVVSIGKIFLNRNEKLAEISLPNAETIGDSFLSGNQVLTDLSLPNVKTIGDGFLYFNEKLTELSLPNAETIGTDFLKTNVKLTDLSLPKAKTIGDNFLCRNEELTELSLPKVETIGDGFLYFNEELTELSLPNIQSIEGSYLYSNEIAKWQIEEQLNNQLDSSDLAKLDKDNNLTFREVERNELVKLIKDKSENLKEL